MKIPHSVEAEAGLLACVLAKPALAAELSRLPADFFYDLRHATLAAALREMHRTGAVIDLTTVYAWLKERKAIRDVGGMPYLSELPDKSPSPENWPYFLAICREKYGLRRLLAVCKRAEARILAGEQPAHDVMLGVRADLDTACLAGLDGAHKPALTVLSAADLAAYVPDPSLCLVGDNEVTRGYDGLVLIAGPGGAGKSLAALTLALAGARGCGLWMGRKVHRQFRTLILQAENGLVRIKKEFDAMRAAHPELKLEQWIFICSPPEGGLPFHRPEFRAAVREWVKKLQPDLIIIDPWSQVAAEDSAKDVVDKLAEIRSCWAAGEESPGLVIVAHTKKPRAEEVRKGRNLMFQVSGSVALVNTARTVYMLLPWSEDMDDDRIYWGCVKLNNGEQYPASVWRRRFGTFFEHDDQTNPTEWGEDRQERTAISEAQLQDAFGDDEELTSGALVKRLAKLSGAAESTVWRAIGEQGYLRSFLVRTGYGRLALKKGEARQ